MAKELENQLSIQADLEVLLDSMKTISTLLDSAFLKLEDMYLDSEHPVAMQAKTETENILKKMG